MGIFSVKNDKVYLSSYIRQLLNKKINFFRHKDADHTQKFIFTIPSYRKLIQIKLPFFKKIKIVFIAFSLLLLYFIRIFTFTLKRNRIQNRKTVLIYSFTKDQILRDNSLYRFHDFLINKKFKITEKNEVLIECRGIWRTKKYSNLTVTLDIPLRIFTIKFSVKEQIKLILIFFYKLVILVKSFNQSQYLYLVFKEYIFDENVYLAIVNKNQVNKIITSTGNTKYQPIIFEMSEFTGERVMLWYSSNSTPIKYKSTKGSIIGKNQDIFLKHMTIDTHWVWTGEHKKYLMKMTNSKVLIKKSMLFYNAPKKINHKKKYDIVIFDVTPVISKNIYNNTIFTFPIAKEFVADIIESVKLVSQKMDQDISIYIKHKRPFKQVHSSEYITYINELVKNKQLFVLPIDSDLYETIAASKLIIGFPFTSPVIIGQELKVSAIHYSSSNILINYNKSNFIQNRLQLIKFLEKKFNE